MVDPQASAAIHLSHSQVARARRELRAALAATQPRRFPRNAPVAIDNHNPSISISC